MRGGGSKVMDSFKFTGRCTRGNKDILCEMEVVEMIDVAIFYCVVFWPSA